MTIPVSIYVVPVEGEDDPEEREMCFFIGEEHQANPPTPTNPDVYIQARPEMRIVTR